MVLYYGVVNGHLDVRLWKFKKAFIKVCNIPRLHSWGDVITLLQSIGVEYLDAFAAPKLTDRGLGMYWTNKKHGHMIKINYYKCMCGA